MHRHGGREEPLTPRERQVLELLRLGYSNRGIAEELNISVSGARYHVSEILSKLGVATREEAAAWKPRGRRWSLGLLFARHFGSTHVLAKAAGVVVLVGAVFTALALVRVLSDDSTPQEISGWRLAWIQEGDLWIKQLPDGQSVQVTNDGQAWLPRWSLSGDWLTEGDVYGVGRVLKGDGTHDRLPTRLGIWSPVDDVLAVPTDLGFRVETPEGAILHNVDLRSTIREERNVDTQVYPPYDPLDVGVGMICTAWSPNGRQLACNIIGNVVTSADGARSQYSGIWVVNVDGSGAREVFGNDAYSQGGGWVSMAGWKRDGTSIAFSLGSASEFVQCWETGECSLSDGRTIYEASATGDDLLALDGSLVWGSGWLHGQRFEDGSAWPVAEGAGRETWANKRIALINDSGSLTYLTESDQASIQPTWSPDGEQIAYSAGPDIGSLGYFEDGSYGRNSYEAQQALAQRRIWVMNADGSNKRQLTSDDRYRDERPVWSPDGSLILFARLDAESQASLWVIPSSGGMPHKVADLSGPTSGDSTRVRRENAFDKNFDIYGAIPWSYLYTWWQPSD